MVSQDANMWDVPAMIFISWAGKGSKSHKTAELLKDSIPKVIQRQRCFLSSHDIEAGAAWLPTLFERLEECDVGILCLSKHNLNRPWLLFEAGTVAKRVSGARVCPLLIDITSETEIPYPSQRFR